MTALGERLTSGLRVYWSLLVAAVLVGGSLLIVNLTGPDAGDVDTTSGQFAGLRSLDDELMKRADTASLRFPDGILTVSLGGPVDRIVEDYGPTKEGYRAPDDGSLLPIETRLQTALPYSIATAPAVSSDDSPEVTIIADGRRYPVRSGVAADDAVLGLVRGALAVAGRPRDVRVEATLGGIRQSVRPATGERDAGRAAGLYRSGDGKTSSEEISCTGRRLPAGYRLYRSDERSARCKVTGVARTAYVRGLGWAAAGRTWLLVVLEVADDLDVARTTAPGAGQEYDSVKGDDDLTVTIDGRPTRGSPRTNGARLFGPANAIAVAQVAPDAKTVRLGIAATFHRMSNRSEDIEASAPVDPDVSIEWTVTVP